MSCAQTVVVEGFPMCPCDECLMAQGCEACLEEDCLIAGAKSREHWLKTNPAPCSLPGCPVTATKAVLAGYDDRPKVYDVCAGHGAKLAGVA